MRIEIDNVVVVVEYVPYLKGTATAPEEGGYLEVVDIEGFYTDDDMPDIEDRAIAEAEDRMAGEIEDRYSKM